MVKASKAVALQKKGKATGGKRPRQQLNAESGSRKPAAGSAKRQKTQVSMHTHHIICNQVDKWHATWLHLGTAAETWRR